MKHFALIIALKIVCTLRKSSNRSPGNFNISAKLSNIQTMILFQRKVLYTRSKFSNYYCDPPIYPVSTAKIRRVPLFVTTHQSIPFIWLKTGQMTKTLLFLTNGSFMKLQKPTYSVKNGVLPSFTDRAR